MDNIEIGSEIDPVKEMEHLKEMYKHYKILYRKLILLCACCFNEAIVVKRKRDEYKHEIQKVIDSDPVARSLDSRCQNL